MILQVGGILCLAGILGVAIAGMLYQDPEPTQDESEANESSIHWTFVFVSAAVFAVGAVLCFTGAVLWIIKVA